FPLRESREKASFSSLDMTPQLHSSLGALEQMRVVASASVNLKRRHLSMCGKSDHDTVVNRAANSTTLSIRHPPESRRPNRSRGLDWGRHRTRCVLQIPTGLPSHTQADQTTV